MTLHRRDMMNLSALLGVSLILPGAGRAQPSGETCPTDTLSALADTIIPETDTPGAVAAGVVPFILLMVSDWFTSGERERFWNGHSAFDAQMRQEHGRPFAALAPAERIAVLERALLGPSPRPAFLELVRRLTIFGYYTSEIGATRELDYNMGGEYVPDAPVDPTTPAPALARRFHTFSMI